MSKGRSQVSLYEMARAAKLRDQKEKAALREHRIIEECRRNVIKCNCYGKLKYCIGG